MADRIDPSAWPLYPPAEWFDMPESMPDDVYCHVITAGPEAGRVYGYVHHAGSYLLGRPEFTPQPSPSDLHDCQLGVTETADGSIIRTANVGGRVNHAPIRAAYQEAVKHYENTATQTMRVRYHLVDTPSGPAIGYSGAMWPDVSEIDVARVRASGLSGDWRWRPEYDSYDFAGSQLVTNPGLPLRMVASLDDPEHPAFLAIEECPDGACFVDIAGITAAPGIEEQLDDLTDAVVEFADLLGYEIEMPAEPPPATAAICAPADVLRDLECVMHELVVVAAARPITLDFRPGKDDTQLKLGKPEWEKSEAEHEAEADDEWWTKDEHGRFTGSHARTGAATFVEEDHPRVPAGDPAGGQFTSDGGGGGGDAGAPMSEHDRELQQARDRGEHVNEVVQANLDKDTEATFNRDKPWDPDRVEQQQAALDRYWAEHNLDDVPQDREALVMGGLPGAGKSSILQTDELGVDPSQFVTVNPDDMKELMVREHMDPDVPGLKPMEKAFLTHEESSKMAADLNARAMREGRNIILDGTMGSKGSMERKIEALKADGYSVRMVFVDVPLELSQERALDRYARASGTEDGGRYVPPSVIAKQADPEFGSVNRRNFEDLKGQVDSWQLWDNQNGPKLLEQS